MSVMRNWKLFGEQGGWIQGIRLVGGFIILAGIVAVATGGVFAVESLWFGTHMFLYARKWNAERALRQEISPVLARRRSVLLILTQILPLYLLAYATRIIVYIVLTRHGTGNYVALFCIFTVGGLLAVQFGPPIGKIRRRAA